MTKQLTLREKQSLIVEMLMKEDPSAVRVFSLLNQLHSEKELLLEKLVNGDQNERQTLWPQLDQVKSDISDTEEYIEYLIKKVAPLINSKQKQDN